VTVTCYLALNGKYLAKIVRENSNPAQTYFLHADMVGSIRAITDSAGQVVARFDYEPFDLLAVSTGPMASGAHRFTGKPEDGATKLYYFGARYYDPEVGRFISRDPARQGPNWYIYCGNPRSACRCYHFGIWALPWASQPDDKTALRGDRPDKTMRSRGLSSLPENRTVFSSTCRNSVRFCAVGRNRRPFRGL
jgi:RHS repeat-associated protein